MISIGTEYANTIIRKIGKGATKMKEKLTYIGAGAGLVLFTVYGLLPGSFIGGVMGLNISGVIFGYPVSGGVLPRIIVAVSMLLGVMVSGLIFLVAGTTFGWLLGSIIDLIKKPKKVSVNDKYSQKM